MAKKIEAAGTAAAAGAAESPYHVQVLDRAFRILDLLSEHPEQSSLPEIAAALDLHKSTAHRLLTVLEHQRFVERNDAGRYYIGSRIVDLGLAALSRLDLYEVARPYLRSLVDATGETAHLAVLREGKVVSLLNVDSSRTLRMPGAVGDRRPLHCTATGKAILAWTPADDLARVLANYSFESFTPKTIRSLSRLRTELKATQQRGYSVDDEEWELGLRCLGAPVQDSSGATVAAISISGPASRITTDQLARLAASVRQTAGELSRRLGYRAARTATGT